MVYHQFCRKCKKILTLAEMEQHLKDLLGLCETCKKEDKKDE